MNKTSMLTLVAAILLLSLLVKFLWSATMFTRVETTESFSEARQFNVFLYQKKPFSFSIWQSDHIRNATLLTHLVGGLVKEDNTGRFRKYLAKSIDVSADKKVWRFEILPNLICEDGEKITAKSYAKNLLLSLKRYRIRGPVLEFEKLLGSEKLLNWKTVSIPGISYSGNTLIFKFGKPPERLLDRLTDKYFGYLCESNFTDDLKDWKDNGKITSSGPFTVSRVNSMKDVEITIRKNFELSKVSQVSSARFRIVDDVSQISSTYSYAVLSNQIPKKNEMKLVEGVPTFTLNLSVPAGKKNLFFNLKIREALMKAFYLKKNQSPFQEVGTTPSNNIFPLTQKDYFKDFAATPDKQRSFDESKIAVVSMSSSVSEAGRSYLLQLLKDIGKKMNFSIELYSSQKHGKDDGIGDKPYDLRITSVALGSVPYFSLLDMIFCSELGVRYPDPDGGICKFIKPHLSTQDGPLSVSQIEELHTLIKSKYVLMPIAHRSLSFLYSSEIDLKSVSGSVLWSRVDLLRFH